MTDPPDDGPRSGATGDLLSHVLAQIRLSGDGVTSNRVAVREHLALDADAGHVVAVTEGALQLVDEREGDTVAIAAGDLVLLPHGLGAARLVASRDTTCVVCRFRFDPYGLSGMVSALPKQIHIRHADSAIWLDRLIQALLLETSDTQPGAALMISRVIDVLVIRILRTWVQLGQTSGWLGGLSDARIARALKLMHREPIQTWSVDALADVAGMSRSSFAERFAQLVGLSPLRYQNEWRLNLARDLLAWGDTRVGEIGLRIGYESEAAFSRAYKALFGHSPRDESGRRRPKDASG